LELSCGSEFRHQDLNTREVDCRLLQLIMLTFPIFCTRNFVTVDPSQCINITVMNDATGFLSSRHFMCIIVILGSADLLPSKGTPNGVLIIVSMYLNYLAN